ncbi:MAG: hypothetical protein LQ351_003744 [Letrouitia transgressa]|nr:MAG: hypothetical protein LQ351_003744 [Letrouitia transgressa]
MFSFIKKIFHIGNPSINEEPDNLPSRDQMRSFLITNASSKLGFEFIQKLHGDKRNILIGLVEDKNDAEKLFPNSRNIKLVEANVADQNSLKSAVKEVAVITGGAIDYLINQPAHITDYAKLYGKIQEAHSDVNKPLVEEYELTRTKNFCGFYDTIQAFTPLLRNGAGKKILVVSLVPAFVTPMSIVEDPQIRAQCYVNKAVATMNDRMKKYGILIFVMGPEHVGPEPNGTSNQWEMVSEFSACASEYAQGGSTKGSVSFMLKVLDMVKLEKDASSFISYSGTKLLLK